MRTGTAGKEKRSFSLSCRICKREGAHHAGNTAWRNNYINYVISYLAIYFQNKLVKYILKPTLAGYVVMRTYFGAPLLCAISIGGLV